MTNEFAIFLISFSVGLIAGYQVASTYYESKLIKAESILNKLIKDIEDKNDK